MQLVNMRSYFSSLASECNVTKILIKRENLGTDLCTQREHLGKIKAETVVLSQAKVFTKDGQQTTRS